MCEHLGIAFGHHGCALCGSVVLVGTNGGVLCRTVLTSDVGRYVVECLCGGQVALQVVGRLQHLFAQEGNGLVDAVGGTRSRYKGSEVTLGVGRGTVEGLAGSAHDVVLERHLRQVLIVEEVDGIAAGLVLDDVVHHVDVLAVACVKLLAQGEGNAAVLTRHADGVVGYVHILCLGRAEPECAVARVERSHVDNVVGNDDGSSRRTFHVAQVDGRGVVVGSHVERVARNL